MTAVKMMIMIERQDKRLQMTEMDDFFDDNF